MDDDLLIATDDSCVTVNGIHMSAAQSEGIERGLGVCCVYADGGATLALHGCDLSCGGEAAVQIGHDATALVANCCIHDCGAR